MPCLSLHCLPTDFHPEDAGVHLAILKFPQIVPLHVRCPLAQAIASAETSNPRNTASALKFYTSSPAQYAASSPAHNPPETPFPWRAFPTLPGSPSLSAA